MPLFPTFIICLSYKLLTL